MRELFPVAGAFLRQTSPHSDDDASSKWRSRKELKIRRTPVGLGVFAGKRYAAEAVIGEIDGVVIEDDDYTSSYCMDMGDARCLEPSAPFRYVNHSCQPNCGFRWFDLTSADEPEPRRRVFLLALTEIAAGQQFTIDYRWPARMAIPCRCGSAECRGWVVAAEDLDEAVRLNAESSTRAVA